MPIPILIGAIAAAGAALVGMAGHSVAKETNAEAQEMAEKAQRMYNKAKKSLEKKKEETENGLVKFGTEKKNILDGSMRHFVNVYERVKHIELRESQGMNELSALMIQPADAIQIREMTNIYSSALSSSAAGAATGVIITLAASGALPIMTSAVSAAGSAVLVGQVSTAAGILSSAASLGAAVTPLAAIVAPAYMFTGISAAYKAEVNLEKAETMYLEAELAKEKMETAEVMCQAILDRTSMLNDTMNKLNGLFSQCVYMLDKLTKKKMRPFGLRKIKIERLTVEELELIGITRALAGAIKAIIDTPLLDNNGELTKESQELCERHETEIPRLTAAVDHIDKEKILGTNQCKELPASASTYVMKPANPGKDREVAIGVLSLVLGFVVAAIVGGAILDNLAVEVFLFLVIPLIGIKYNTKVKFFLVLKYVYSVLFGLCNGSLLADYLESTETFETSFMTAAIICAIVAWIIAHVISAKREEKYSSFRRTMGMILGCLSVTAFSILAYVWLAPYTDIDMATFRASIVGIDAIVSVIICCKF